MKPRLIRLALVITIGAAVLAPAAMSQGFQKPQTKDPETLALDIDDAKFNLGYLSTLNKPCKLGIDSAKVLFLFAELGVSFEQSKTDPTIQRAIRTARKFYNEAPDAEHRDEICSGAWQASDYLRP